jgi:hypothetical protein
MAAEMVYPKLHGIAARALAAVVHKVRDVHIAAVAVGVPSEPFAHVAAVHDDLERKIRGKFDGSRLL